MKKSIFILLQFALGTLLVQSEVCAQNLKKRDSLENYLKTAEEDTAKANALTLLSYELVQYDIRKAEKHALESIRISKKINAPKNEAAALVVLTRIYREQKNDVLALDKIITALHIFERLEDKEGQAKAYFELGYIYKEISDYKKAISSFSKSSALYKEIGDETKAINCQMIMAHVNMDRSGILKDASYIEKALVLYTTVSNYYKKINDQKKIAVSLINIANLYLSYNRLSPSEDYLDKSLDYTSQSLKITTALNDKPGSTVNLINIGEVYFDRKNYTLALKSYLQAYHMAKEIGNVDYTLETLHFIILTYKEIKTYDKALEFSKEYLEIAQKGNYIGNLKKHYKILSEIYLAQNKFEKAYESRLLYEKYSDSVLDDEKAKAFVKFQIEFESANKDKEISLLSKNQELQNSRIKQQNTIRNYLIASIVLVLLLLMVIYSRYVVKTKTNRIIQEKNKELEKLSIVARETANGVFITDANGELEWFNEGFSKLFGWKSIEEYKAKRGKNIFEVSGNDGIAILIKEAIQQKKSITYENPTPAKNRDNLWIQTTLTPIFDQYGKLNKLVFVEADITKLKNSEEQLLNANKELESFSYSVSHDLRAPLRAISGYSQILQEDYATNMDTDGISALNAIHNNSKKMGMLINDLLAFSRLGRAEMIISEINMETLVKSVIDEEMTGNQNKIKFTLKELLPSNGASALIKQVWINLISNAVKYSKNTQKPNIEIGSYSKDNLVVYYIKDNGAGFDMQYYNKLFGVFQRLHSQEEFEGTGIGLAIVQKIIHRHNGTVWAESKLNEGSCFYFSLPTINS